jgi:hypothetical protein
MTTAANPIDPEKLAMLRALANTLCEGLADVGHGDAAFLVALALTEAGILGPASPDSTPGAEAPPAEGAVAA